MPKKTKKILYGLLEKVGPFLIRLFGFTWRIQRVNNEKVDALIKEGKNVLWAIWHGRMLIPMFVHRGEGVVVMISRHADGEMVANIVKKLGFGAARGSSTRGGKEAFQEMLEVLKAGKCGGMLSDGPTGPRHRLKLGTLLLASQAQVPCVPMIFAAKSFWRLKSWDRFVIPKPFSRCVLYYGDPLIIPPEIPEEDIETWRLKLERIMIDLEKQADQHFHNGSD